MNDLGHIGVLLGGYSSEREISLKSGNVVFEALKSSGCQVSRIDITTQDRNGIATQLMDAKIDVAFIALHGILGEDGTIQEILEKENIAYTGSGIEASRLAIDKVKTKEIFIANDIPTPKYQLIKKGEDIVVDQYPVILKPVYEGSSIGITILESGDNLNEALEESFKYGDEILIEQYIDGRELTVGILEEKPLSIVEIKPKQDFYDFSAKYEKGMSEFIVPAQLSNEQANQIQDLSLQVHKQIGCEDLSRVDLMMDEREDLYFLEINTIPGFTSLSLVPMAAEESGINFNNLCLKLVELAYAKKIKTK